MTIAALPVPDPDIASAPFFAALDAGRLEIRRCTGCGTPHLAVIRCDTCGGAAFLPEAASGAGIVYSVTRVHQAFHPAFSALLPVTGGIVELAEGPRLFAPLLGEGAYRIGQPVVLELLQVEQRVVAAFRAARPG